MKRHATFMGDIGRVIFMIAVVAVIAHIVMIATATPSFAQGGPPPSMTPRGTCSNDPDFRINLGGGAGIITGIVNTMQSVLNSVTATLYNSIVSNGSYSAAVKAMVVLYIAITGIFFTIGATQITVNDVIIRSVKAAIVGLIVSPASWNYFNNTVGTFFLQGTNDIINLVTNIAVGGTNLGGYPFAPLDGAISNVLSAKMLVTLLAMVSPIPPYAPTGPNGLLVGLLIVSGLGSFMRATINAMWVYLMAMVLKAFMFAVAPLFIPFILFNRTRHLFDGWLNQVVNACLQPIMLFAFFAFFVGLMSIIISGLLQRPVCWTEWTGSIRGGTQSQFWWRFTIPDGALGGYAPYGGVWDFTGTPMGHPFPIDVLTVIAFVMLAELALRFNAMVIEIAKDISGAATNLSGAGGSISEWFVKASNSDVRQGTGGTPGDVLGGGQQPGSRPGGNNNFLGGNGGLFGPNGLFGNGTTAAPSTATPSSRGAGATGNRAQTGGGLGSASQVAQDAGIAGPGGVGAPVRARPVTGTRAESIRDQVAQLVTPRR